MVSALRLVGAIMDEPLLGTLDLPLPFLTSSICSSSSFPSSEGGRARAKENKEEEGENDGGG